MHTTRTLRAASFAVPASRTVFVDGVRTPFLVSGTGFKDLIAQELARHALRGLVKKTAIEPGKLDYVCLGNVIQEVRTSNLARESALSADFPLHVPASTVTMACISSNAAVASMASAINAGQMEAAVAGGAETMSDVPIRFSREMRKRMLGAQKGIRSLGDAAKFLRGFKLSYLLPELPAIAEFSTGEVMGHSSDRLAATWGVGRAEQDDFAHRSHRLAAAAARDGLLAEEIVPVGAVTADNGIKGDAPREKLATLAPAFVKPHGTHTAANSSFLTDGASAALLMSEARARADGYAPKSRIVDWLFVGADPRDELLLGPAYAITRLLARNRLAARDVDVWEIHEAFAGQVLANLRALDSDAFVTGKVGLPSSAKVGALDMARVNAWGGSLAIGHPFGATGVRILTTASNRLVKGGGRFAVLAACAAGGQGHAMLVERYVASPGAK